jgi:ketosteroid isomerase-like protein
MTIDPALQEVYELEDRRFRAMASNDVEALNDLLANDLHYVHANGMVEDKAEFIRKITSGERLYRHFVATSREGGFTFVFGEADVEVDRTAGHLKNKLTYTAIYRDGAGPRFVAWHAVKSIAP